MDKTVDIEKPTKRKLSKSSHTPPSPTVEQNHQAFIALPQHSQIFHPTIIPYIHGGQQVAVVQSSPSPQVLNIEQLQPKYTRSLSTPSATSATRSKGYTVSVDEEPQHKHHHLLGYNMQTAPTTPTSANQPMLIAVTPNEASSAYSRTQSSSEIMSRLTSESMMTSKLPGHEIQPNNPLQMVYYLVHSSSLSLDATATSLEEVKRQPAVDNNNTDVNYTSYRDVAMGNSTPLFTDNNT